MAVPKVLIVDDDAAVRGLLRVTTERCGIRVDEAASGIECLDLLGRNVYDVVLIDLATTAANGRELLECLRRNRSEPAIIVLTALTHWTLVGIDLAEVHCILRKPVDLTLAAAVVVSTAAAIQERRTDRTSPRLPILRDDDRPAI